jgi:hypothetical protein
MVRQIEKGKVINAISQKLFESVDAEKSAVLATSDEESRAFAKEATDLNAEIDRLRGKLRELVTVDARSVEVEKLNSFDGAWKELQQIDARLLGLAVANTNLKAARLLSRDGDSALSRFVDALTELQSGLNDADLLRTLARAEVAGLRSQSALFAHIPSADAAEMTRLEQRVQQLGEEVERALTSVRDSGKVDAQQLAAAAAAWGEYRKLSAEVVRLSRENSNVISFDVSVHDKRLATKACLNALTELSAAVESAPRPMR